MRALAASLLFAMPMFAMPILTAPTTRAEPIPVEIALAGVQEAYRSGPVVDRVSVTLVDERGVRATERLIVRIDAAADSPVVALDLGRLHVSATGGRFVAIHDTEATTCFLAEVPDPLTVEVIDGLLPPLPVPQVRTALSLDARLDTAYTPDIRWLEADLNEQVRPAEITLTGRSEHGQASAVLDATTGRLRRFDAAIVGGSLSLSLEISPGDPSGSWMIDPGARRPVQRLGDLTRPPRDLRVGDPAPNVRAISLPSTSWSLHDAIGTTAPHGVGMLAFRAFEPGAHADQVLRDVVAARDAVVRSLSTLEYPAFRLHAVAIVEQPVLDLLDALAVHWTRGLNHAQVDPALPWTQDSLRAIDAFNQELDAILVLVDAERRVRGVYPLDGLAEQPDSIDESLLHALRAMRPEPPVEQPIEATPEASPEDGVDDPQRQPDHDDSEPPTSDDPPEGDG